MNNIDTLIRHARIIDGSGNPWCYGDVALSDAHISAIAPPGQIDPQNAANVVDGTGKVICLGG